MKTEREFCCKELMKADVLDSNGQKVGKIGDLTFKFDDGLHLSKFILAGPRWEELLESLHIKPDKDPVFDGSMIKRVDKNVHLNTNIENLKTTLDKDSIPREDIRYTAIEKMHIIDKNGVTVGHAVDIDIDEDESVSMIVGGGFIEEKLEAFGIKKDVDIVVPGHTISSIKNEIQLNVSKDELETTMEDAIKSEKSAEAREKRDIARQVKKVHLFAHRPF